MQQPIVMYQVARAELEEARRMSRLVSERRHAASRQWVGVPGVDGHETVSTETTSETDDEVLSLV